MKRKEVGNIISGLGSEIGRGSPQSWVAPMRMYCGGDAVRMPDVFKKKSEDDHEDDLEEFSQLMRPKSPFAQVSDQLWTLDYSNRIIVIDGMIDQKCITYAKMIEHWNRYDSKALSFKAELLERLESDEDFARMYEAYKNQSIDKEETNKFTQIIGDIGYKYVDDSFTPSLDMVTYEPKPIKIKISSPGGIVTPSVVLCQIIRQSKTPVIAINIGMVYSAAIDIFISCSKRYTFKDSSFLIHRGSGGFVGTAEQIESANAHYQVQLDRQFEDLKRATKITQDDLVHNMKPDWFMFGDEALDYGLADHFIESIEDLL